MHYLLTCDIQILMEEKLGGGGLKLIQWLHIHTHTAFTYLLKFTWGNTKAVQSKILKQSKTQSMAMPLWIFWIFLVGQHEYFGFLSNVAFY